MTLIVDDVPLYQLAQSTPPLSALTALHQRGQRAFAAQGVPTRQTEAYRYCALPLSRAMGGAVRVAAAVCPQAGTDLPVLAGAYSLPIRNGRWEGQASCPLPAGVSVRRLSEALHDPILAPLVQAHLGQLAPLEQWPMAALASALAAGMVQDGVVIHVAAGACIDTPLHLCYMSEGETSADEAALTLPRLLLVAEDDSRVTILESHHVAPHATPHVGTLGRAGKTLSAAVGELWLGERATVHHLTVIEGTPTSSHLHARQARLSASASYQALAVTLGGALVRHDLGVDLAAPQAQAFLGGAYAADGSGVIDTAIAIDHRTENGVSEQLYRGVVADQARGVFQGKVTVHPAAQQTNGQQNHKALLLSPQAEVDVKPELYIHADDVRCAHGAACGELDAEALFYLQARGLDDATARALLIEGFLQEVLDRLDDADLRDWVGLRVQAWLAARR